RRPRHAGVPTARAPPFSLGVSSTPPPPYRPSTTDVAGLRSRSLQRRTTDRRDEGLADEPSATLATLDPRAPRYPVIPSVSRGPGVPAALPATPLPRNPPARARRARSRDCGAVMARSAARRRWIPRPPALAMGVRY